ncbi:MAG: AmmeMemoRadiSam system protein B [Candidatus Omnitrophota bacterium]
MVKPEKIRQPVVAGKFYPSSSRDLKEQIGSFLSKDAEKSDVIACMLPHAGYAYSGAVAGETLSRVKIKDRVILLGPNHTGYGPKYSIMPEGVWQTPLGETAIDSEFAGEILNRCKYLEADDAAHAYEHSLEVELPFLQYSKNDLKIVPIIFMSDEPGPLKEIGKDIAGYILGRDIKDRSLIIASSDMTHYEPQAQAEKKDKEAIKAILELDEDMLIDRVRRLNISMCGYAPVITMISAAKSLGAKTAELIKYQTSGDVSGDKSSVVGYAGIIVY